MQVLRLRSLRRPPLRMTISQGAAVSAFLAPEMEQSHRADHDSRNDGHGPHGMRDAAMVLELVDRAAQSPKNVEIGGLGGQYGGEGGVGRFAVESGAA